MKRATNVFLLGVLGIFGIVLFAHFASAYYLPPVRYAIESVVQSFVDVFEPILQALLGGNDWSGYILFEKLLLFLILYAMVYTAVGFVPMFESNKGIRRMLSVIVPLLGLRFMPTDWVLEIINSYQVLAIALTSILPFVIYFFFIYNLGAGTPMLRKLGWGLFVLVYLGLWSTIGSELHSAVYFWTVVAGVVALIFDSSIYRIYSWEKMKGEGNLDKWREIANLREDVRQVNEQVRNGHLDAKVGQKLIKKNQKHIDWLMKNM